MVSKRHVENELFFDSQSDYAFELNLELVEKKAARPLNILWHKERPSLPTTAQLVLSLSSLKWKVGRFTYESTAAWSLKLL